MPAAAVIPAPIAYIKVVAVKKLVVGFVGGATVPTLCVGDGRLCPSLGGIRVALFVVRGMPIFYCEKIRVFKAGLRR